MGVQEVRLLLVPIQHMLEPLHRQLMCVTVLDGSLQIPDDSDHLLSLLEALQRGTKPSPLPVFCYVDHDHSDIIL